MPRDPLELGVKSIDALARGLWVLQLLEREKSLGLQELERATGLARATLLRILKTLAQAGRVGRHAQSGRYLLQPAPLAGDPLAQARSRLSELTAPARGSLERAVPWPVNLAVPDQIDMLVLDTGSSCCLTPNYHALGYRPPLLVSAVGRAYLAWSRPAVRDAAIALALQRGRLRRSVDPEALMKALRAIRAQGHALYDPSHTGTHSPARYGALAVPLLSGTHCVGSLAMVWIPGAAAPADLSGRHAQALQRAGAEMSAVLTAARFRWPGG